MTAMRDLLELQTGQVSFLSGLMAGFALSVAAHILRHGMRHRLAQLIFLMLLLVTLLFLVALYVDVRLTIELVGVSDPSAAQSAAISQIRVLGTSSATLALVMFIVAVGLLGWLARPWVGVASTAMAIAVLVALGSVWYRIGVLSQTLHGATG